MLHTTQQQQQHTGTERERKRRGGGVIEEGRGSAGFPPLWLQGPSEEEELHLEDGPLH